MRKFNIKNAFVPVIGFLLLSGLLGACTSYDYDEEMNNRYKEEARLKAEDEKIKAEIISSIQALHTELMQNIKTMEQTVDDKLSEKDKEVVARFTTAENELKSVIETRAQQAGVKIEELGTTLTNAINGKQVLFDQALSLARQELEKAVKDGDEANIKKAQDAIDLIAKTEQEVKEAGQGYEERINRLLALETRLTAMRTEIEKKEAEKVRILKQAQDFEDRMKALIDSKIQTFRSSDLAKIKKTLADYNAKLSYYDNLSDYTAELESLSSDVADLKKTDAELRKLIETGLTTLNSQITEALGKAETEKRAAIKAKEQGDAATLAKLEELKKRLKEADASMDALNLKVDKWQEQLNSIASKNYAVTCAEFKTRIQALNDIDMETRYQNMQAMLEALTISQYEALTHEDLESINTLINRINDLYKKIYQQYNTIDGDLDKWETQAESECSDLESLASDLASMDLDGVEEVFNSYDGYDGKVDDINTWADDFQNFIDEIQNAVQEVDDKVQEASDLAEEINNDISNLEVVDHSDTVGAIDSIGQQLADDMNNKLQELSDAYPNAWGGSTPSVSW